MSRAKTCRVCRQAIRREYRLGLCPACAFDAQARVKERIEKKTRKIEQRLRPRFWLLPALGEHPRVPRR